MGTSSSQRSPETREWEHVRDAYREGITDPAEISRRVTDALTVDTRRLMSGPGPTTCLDTLLSGVGIMTGDISGDVFDGAVSAIDGISALRMDAQRRLATQGQTSRFADIALDALGASALRTLPVVSDSPSLSALQQQSIDSVTDQFTSRPPRELTRSFVAEDMDRCFRYFVSRDINEFVGTESFPTVNQALQLVDEVGQYSKSASSNVLLTDYEDRLQESLRESDPGIRTQQIQDVFSAAVENSLDEVSAE